MLRRHIIPWELRMKFVRCFKPSYAVGPCQLICCLDWSDDTFATVLYLRWKLMDNSACVSLLCRKPRVTLAKRISTPRSELNGAVIASRLALSTVRSLSSAGVPIEWLWFIGDSECILACLEKANCAFGEYFGNRVGEILDNLALRENSCPIRLNREWWHTASCHNAADQATCSDSCLLDVNQTSQ